jgi:hypothetical protein
MKKYFIIINGTQSEALSFEELKNINLSKKTMVWYEGMENWKEAGELEELKELFKSIPPPIVQPPPIYKQVEEEEETSFYESNKSKIFIGIISIVAIVIVFFSFSNHNVAKEINQTNENTEKLEQQQVQIDEQNKKIAEQEHETLRIKNAKEIEELELKRTQLRNDFQTVINNLNATKQNLNNVTGFKLFRTSDERNQQINNSQNLVNKWNDSIQKINIALTDIIKKLEEKKKFK